MATFHDADTSEDLRAYSPAPAWIPSTQVEIDLGCVSDPGKVRSHNEDSFLIGRTGRFMDILHTSLAPELAPRHHEATGLGMLVADGMGGHASGEVASRLALSTLIQMAHDVPDWILLPRTMEHSEELLRRIEGYYRQVSVVLNRAAMEDRRLVGMGTTLTLTYSLGASLFVVHVGDSRAYLFRGGQLIQLTHDQTMAQAMVDAGVIPSEKEAPTRAHHILTSALGGTISHPRIEVQQLPLQDGDQVLLCSDGLTGMVPDQTITTILACSNTPQKSCDSLLALALEKGGKDNITILLARYRIASTSRAG